MDFLAINDSQKALCEAYYADPAMLNKFSPDEYATCASEHIEKVNGFLETEGFSARLSPGSEAALYVAARLKIKFQWPTIGHQGSLSAVGVDYRGVRFEQQSGHDFRVYQVTGCSEISEVLSVRATNGDEICMAMPQGDTVFERFALLEAISRWEGAKGTLSNYDSATFPMVDIDDAVDASWLRGLKAQGPINFVKGGAICSLGSRGPVLYEIGQAVQQTKFQMNHKGAAVESAAAMEILDVDGPGEKEYHAFVINRPFYLWIMRQGIATPVFAAFIDQADWKMPVHTDTVFHPRRSEAKCCCLQ